MQLLYYGAQKISDFNVSFMGFDVEEFDQFAQEYQQILDGSLKLGGYKGDYFAEYKAKYMRRLLGQDCAGKILDYGCGIGLLSQALLKALPKAQIHGFDVSSASIEHVAQSLKEHGLFTFDEQKLQSGYDAIVVANVFHHIVPAKRTEVMAKLKQLLSPTGKIVIFEHNPFNPLTRKIVRESPLDKEAILLPSKETVMHIKNQGLQKHLDYIVFFPKALSALEWMEPYLGWCPLGAQYTVIGSRSSCAN